MRKKKTTTTATTTAREDLDAALTKAEATNVSQHAARLAVYRAAVTALAGGGGDAAKVMSSGDAAGFTPEQIRADVPVMKQAQELDRTIAHWGRQNTAFCAQARLADKEVRRLEKELEAARGVRGQAIARTITSSKAFAELQTLKAANPRMFAELQEDN